MNRGRPFHCTDHKLEPRKSCDLNQLWPVQFFLIFFLKFAQWCGTHFGLSQWGAVGSSWPGFRRLMLACPGPPTGYSVFVISGKHTWSSSPVPVSVSTAELLAWVMIPIVIRERRKHIKVYICGC